MVRKIVRDEAFLSLPSYDVESADKALAEDLKDTLLFHKDECIGLAANMIGVRKKAMCIMADSSPLVLFNPIVISRSDEYEAEEGCLSLKGNRKTRRFREIEVMYLSERGRAKVRIFSGIEAEAVQHEMDHMEGIVI
ncbi:MAG: peptide deformylase [Candidatus Ornithospirochaeta sp.]